MATKKTGSVKKPTPKKKEYAKNAQCFKEVKAPPVEIDVEFLHNLVRAEMEVVKAEEEKKAREEEAKIQEENDKPIYHWWVNGLFGDWNKDSKYMPLNVKHWYSPERVKRKIQLYVIRSIISSL